MGGVNVSVSQWTQLVAGAFENPSRRHAASDRPPSSPPQAVEDFSDLHSRAWQMLAAEEGKPAPFAWALRRAEGMKNEQVSTAAAAAIRYFPA